MTIKAIVFDLDGVLVDTPELHYEALNQALGLFGFNISRQDHDSKFNGLPTRTKLEMLNVDPAIRGLVMELKQQYTRQAISKIQPNYQKIMMLRSLSWRYHLGVASNALQDTCYSILEAARLDSYFTTVWGGDGVKKTKPDPEIYRKIIKKLEVQPDQCLVLEDTQYGVQAALGAGAQCIQVTYPQVHSGLFVRKGLL